MKHYIIYQKEEKREKSKRYEGIFSAFTAKAKENWTGGMVWIILGSNKPRNYKLFYCFKINRVLDKLPGNKKRYIVGNENEGKWFAQSANLNSLPWFRDLLSFSQNFRFAAFEIKDKKIIDGLENV